MKCIKCEKRNESKKRIWEIADDVIYMLYVLALVGICFGIAGFVVGYSLCLETVMKVI